MSGTAGESFRKERYIVYDFLVGHPILIARPEKMMTLYHKNLYGQVYDLDTARSCVIGQQRIDGLIRRTANPHYSFVTEKVIDSYIYAYFMTPAERAMCKVKPSTYDLHTYIVATDDYGEAIREMCEWVYENQFCAQLGDKEERREELLQYYRAYLTQHPAPPAANATGAPKSTKGKNHRPRPDVGR